MVAVAQVAERRNVDPEATGSNPVRHPFNCRGQVTGTACPSAAFRRLSPVPYPLVLYPGGGTADSPGSDPGGRTALRVRIPPRVLCGQVQGGGQPAETSTKADCCPLSPVPCPLRFFAPVAQRTRAPDYGSGGPRFESWRRHFSRDSSVGRAPALGAGGPRFESASLDWGARWGTGRSSARKSAGFGYQRPAVRFRASRLQDRWRVGRVADCARVLTARARPAPGVRIPHPPLRLGPRSSGKVRAP